MKTKLITALITSSWIGVAILIQPAIAQIAPSTTTSSEALGFPRDNDEGGDFFSNSSTSATSILDLINRIQSINQGSPEFAGGLDDAAAKFRAQQIQRLQGQQLSPGTPGRVNPAPVQ